MNKNFAVVKGCTRLKYFHIKFMKIIGEKCVKYVVVDNLNMQV